MLQKVVIRTNLTMRQLAPLFGCSPATVCRVIQRLRSLLAIEPAARPADAVERLWIVDGTLIPVRDGKAGVSSRNYRLSADSPFAALHQPVSAVRRFGQCVGGGGANW